MDFGAVPTAFGRERDELSYKLGLASTNSISKETTAAFGRRAKSRGAQTPNPKAQTPILNFTPYTMKGCSPHLQLLNPHPSRLSREQHLVDGRGVRRKGEPLFSALLDAGIAQPATEVLRL